jgi:hypothetical protein
VGELHRAVPLDEAAPCSGLSVWLSVGVSFFFLFGSPIAYLWRFTREFKLNTQWVTVKRLVLDFLWGL